MPLSVAETNRAVYAALAGNIAVAITKCAAAALSGSSAMLAEGFHSFVDAGDAALLLLGRRRAALPPDSQHPFGHGQELYFWTFIVALMVFAVGGGASIYEGIMHLRHPEPTGDPRWNYIVLAIAAVLEGGSFVVGFRQFRSEAGSRGFWRTVRTTKDPTTFTVVFEDTVDLLGIAVAFVAVWAGDHFGNPAFDAAGSLLIGVILTAVSVVLARESKGLLVGEGMEPETLAEICRITRADPAVKDVQRPLTVYFGPHTVLLAMEIQFRSGLAATEISSAIDRIEKAISTAFPRIRHVFIEAKSITAQVRSDRAA